MAIVAAVGYGIVHDLVTAHLCVEYFTLGHSPLFDTESPILLAICWGTAASWWGGAILGLGVALAARAGRRPTFEARDLLYPMMFLLMTMALSAIDSGLIGYVLAVNGKLHVYESIARDLSPEKQPAFVADMWAHGASYLVAMLGGLVLIITTWRRRARIEG